MSILQQDDSSLDITLGQVLRLPCKFIKGESSADKILIKSISQQLSTTGKNILPVFVKVLEEDDYQAVLNTQILDAAKLAKLDFVWCIVVDDQMQEQVQIESGQLPLHTKILTVSEQEIVAAYECIKVVDDQMQDQVQNESGQLPQSHTNILTAPEQEIVAAFEYIKAHRKGFEKVKPQQVGKAIIEYRKTRKLKSLSFLTNLKCGIGKAKLPTLSEFLEVA